MYSFASLWKFLLVSIGILILCACRAPDATGTTSATSDVTDSACRQVTSIDPTSEDGQAIAQALFTSLAQGENLEDATDFALDKVGPMTRLDEWIIVPASFTRYREPGIWLMQATASEYERVPGGWSGIASSAQAIRDDLASQDNGLPSTLVACAQLPIGCSSSGTNCGLSWPDDQ